MGNSVLDRLATPRARHDDGLAAARTASPARHADHAPATRSAPARATTGTAAGAAQTPFTVLQHTIAGAGNLQYERRRYRVKAGRHDAHHRAAQPSLLAGGGRPLGVLLDFDERPGSGAHPPHHPGDRPGRCSACGPRRSSISRGCCLRLVEGEGETPGAASAIAYEAAMALYDEVFGSLTAARPDGEDSAVRPRDRARPRQSRQAAHRLRPRRDRRLQPRAFLADVRGERRRRRRRSSCCRSACGGPRGC